MSVVTKAAPAHAKLGITGRSQLRELLDRADDPARAKE
jgi:hypothetical protein